MSSAGSNKVIFIALCANLAIAISKLAGAFFTRSASLLAEAIHSLADCTNQIFLLIGSKQSKKAPDELHPLGYGRESFFWSFMVALLLFSMGGVFAIYEGVHKLLSPVYNLKYPWVGFSILVVSIFIEVGSFWACLKEVRKQNKQANLWLWFRESTASELIVIFIEDLAAVIGLSVAALFLLIAIVTENPIWDALGSIFIGAILVAVAGILAREVKSLLLGERSATNYKNFITPYLNSLNSELHVLTLLTLVTGPSEVMIAMKLHPGKITDCSELINLINNLEKKIKAEFPEVRWLFIEPDLID